MGTSLNRGIASFTKQAKTRESLFISKFVYLRDDGERARIRFLTDAEDFAFSVFHRPFTNKKLSDPILCLNDPSSPSLDGVDATECRLCAAGDKTAKLMFFAWVFVKYILHPTQNPRIAEDADAPKWAPIKMPNGKAMFKQDIGQVRMLTGGKKLHDSILSLYDENGSLLDSEFSFIRNGVRAASDTTYSFVPTKATAPDAKETEAVAKLGDLSDAALSSTRDYYNAEVEAPVAVDEPVELAEEVVGTDEGEDFADI